MHMSHLQLTKVIRGTRRRLSNPDRSLQLCAILSIRRKQINVTNLLLIVLQYNATCDIARSPNYTTPLLVYAPSSSSYSTEQV